MTQRDQKTLLILILSLVGAGVAFSFLYSFFLGPLAEYNRQIASLEDEVTAKEQQVRGVMQDMPLLKSAREHSLPANEEKAKTAYSRYLDTLFSTKNGWTGVAMTYPILTDAKAASAVPTAPNAAKKPGHTVHKYTVHAKGSLAAVVAALKSLQQTPILHRVNGLTLGRQESSAAANKDNQKDLLTVQLTLEALIAAGTKVGAEPAPKSDSSIPPQVESKQRGVETAAPLLKPDTSMQLPSARHPRRYGDIAKKNIFIGPAPPRSNAAELEFEDSIPSFVRLVATEPTSREAFLRTLVFRTKEIRLSDKKGSGHDTFQIWNEQHTRVLVKAQVLRIDQRDVYFQVGEDVYGIHIGETLADAMILPLSQEKLKSLNLTDLVQAYDPGTDASQRDTKKMSKSGKKRG